MNKYIEHALLFLLCCSLCMAAFPHAPVYGAQERDEKRVLYISSYSIAWEPTMDQVEGLEMSLDYDVTLDFKFMDTKNVFTDAGREAFYQDLTRFLSEVPPYDVIVAGDDAACEFAVLYRETLFSGIPIVFLGVNSFKLAQRAEKYDNMTGIAESLSYYDTILLASELYPEASRIVAVLDDTATGQGERTEFYGYQKVFPELKFQEINVSALSREEVREQVSALGEESVLLYIMCTMDKEGNLYTSAQSAQLIAGNASIPVFTAMPIGIGYGVFGGKIVSHKKMGYQAGQMAMRILNGTDPASIDVIWKPPYVNCFDEKVMEKFGIKRTELPKEAEMINHVPTFIEEYAEIVRVIALAGILFLILTAGLIVDNYRKRKANAGLSEENENLEDTASHDMLTKLLNRSVFMKDLQNKVKEGSEFGLIFFDIDNFKQINDTLGHNWGDEVLRTLASRAAVNCDENMQVYRLAGDEFTAIVSSRDRDIVTVYAMALQNAFAKPFLLDNEHYSLHGSMGAAMFPADGSDAPSLIAAADAAMYFVKNNGKGGIAFYGQKGILR